MFNGSKIKELERRIEQLEGDIGSNYSCIEAASKRGSRGASIRTTIRDLLDHLRLEYKTTPETTQLVVKK